MAGLLKGVKVTESGMLITGAFVGQLLADEGASVVKLESPFRGDYMRDTLGQFRPHKKGHSPLHITLNRNKQSVTVNLKTEAGKDIFWRMLQDSDVFVDGNTAGVMDKLGLGYEEQRKVKPGIVYAQITGFGATGPYATVPAHGYLMNALAGTEPCQTNEKGNAVRAPGEGIAGEGGHASRGTVSGPAYLAFGVAAALFRRERTGKGAYIDVGCSDAVLADSFVGVVLQINKDRIGAAESGDGEGGVVPMVGSSKFNFYRTKDDKFVLIAPVEPRFWERFCHAIGREDLLKEGVGYNRTGVIQDWGPPALAEELHQIFCHKTLREWMDIAVAAHCPIAPANSVSDLVADPQLTWREALVRYHHPDAGDIVVTGNPIKVTGEHYEIYRNAPALGEHTESYLQSLGYSLEQLREWKQEGIV